MKYVVIYRREDSASAYRALEVEKRCQDKN